MLGTLCVLDSQPHEISESQEKALFLLAKKAMNYMNMRKEMLKQRRDIQLSAAQLENLTDQVPGVVYQFRMTAVDTMTFDSLSKGLTELYPNISLDIIKKNARLIFDHVYSEGALTLMEKFRNHFSILLLSMPNTGCS